MMTTEKPPMPNIGALLAPILPALPAASMSTQPAIGVLPLLAPILRSRVQVFSATSTEPWLRLLCYDSAKAARLTELVQSGSLEPHPVSGEVEVDWEYDAKTKYRRLDQETLQALVALEELELTFQLVYCMGDQDGGGDGWRVGEVGVTEKPSPFSAFGGYSTITEADKAFEENRSRSPLKPLNTANLAPTVPAGTPGMDDEDDGYWDRYDATPGPDKRSPAPQSARPGQQQNLPYRPESANVDDDDYYALYDDVQPAMDNHDPDEEAEHIEIAPPMGFSPPARSVPSADPEAEETTFVLHAPRASKPTSPPSLDDERASILLHPRPASSASSNGSRTIEKLEETAERQNANEFGVKTHISRSVRNLWQLARASGIDKEEFERLVKTELEVISMVEDQELS